MTDATKREVLTEEELDTAYWSKTGGLRGVEQAVIAKLLDNNFSPYISPAEARERERRAWDDAIRYAINTARKWPDAAAVRDCRYPSLTPPKHEGVTLSDGKVWRRTDDGGWKYRDHRFEFDAPLCSTPEDFEAVARYLRELDT